MDGQANGQDARSDVTSSAKAAADTSKADEMLPTSADDLETAPEADETDGAKRSREILRGMVKASAGKDDEPAAGDDDDDDDAGETETAAAAAEKPAKKEPEAKEAGDAALSTARDALIRDGWTSTDLDKLSPERVLELGSKRSALQKQQDGFGRQKHEEIAQLKTRLAELEGTGNAAANQPPAAQTGANSSAVADPFADPAMKAIGEKLDKLGEYASPEVQGVIKESFAALMQHFDKTVETRVNARTAPLMQSTEQQMLRSSRAKLSENFPALKDETKFQTVTKKMAALAKTGDYGPGDFDTLMEDACRLTLPAPSIQDVQRKMLEASQKAQNGQMDAGQASKGGEKKAVTAEDRSRHVLRLMKKGKSPEDARRMAMAR